MCMLNWITLYYLLGDMAKNTGLNDSSNVQKHPVINHVVTVINIEL